jgi:hypothetical protein
MVSAVSAVIVQCSGLGESDETMTNTFFTDFCSISVKGKLFSN